MSLPIFQDQNQSLMLLQRSWKANLDPLLASAILRGKALKNINLNQGSTQIPHGLGGVQQGWFLTDIQGAATIYRSAPFDNKNLTLTSSQAVIVNLWVY